MERAINLDALAIAAHPDDIEITSGGLLLKLADLGRKTGALDLTSGEMGTRGTSEERLREAEAAARVLGLSVRENLGLPDSNVRHTRENVLKIAAVLRKYRPHLVILPYWEQRHPDHYNCYLIAKEACFLSGLAKLEIDGAPHRPFKIIYSTYHREMKASFLVDISEQFERKLDAIRCYKSQFEAPAGPNQVYVQGIDIFEYLRVHERVCGMRIRKQYAEPYAITENIEVDDPMLLSIPSV